MRKIREFRDTAVSMIANDHDAKKWFINNLEHVESVRQNCSFDQATIAHDNHLLDLYGYCVFINSNPNCPPFTMDDIKKVYEAAKIVFAEHAPMHLCFSLSDRHGEGSPWVKMCESPEMWAICYGRRILEDTEGDIERSDDEIALHVRLFCQEMVTIVGVSEQVIRDNIAYICYDNEELTAKVKKLLM